MVHSFSGMVDYKLAQWTIAQSSMKSPPTTLPSWMHLTSLMRSRGLQLETVSWTQWPGLYLSS